MRDPHPSSQTFAADVSQRNDHTTVNLVSRDKVTRDVSNGKDFAGNLKIAVPDQTWRAHPPMHLRSFDERCMQVGVIFLKRCNLQFQFRMTCSIT